MRLTRILPLLMPAIFFFASAGCFTGVESTPRINADDVRKQNAAGVSAEALFLEPITPTPPSAWKRGRALLVANDRISLALTAASQRLDRLAGHTIYFEGFTPARSLTGDDASEAVFRADDGSRLYYRIPGVDAARLDTMPSLDVPFTIDLETVARLDSAMRGLKVYVRTPAWYSPDTRVAVPGLRHVEVIIDSVAPGDENFPAAVYFTLTDPELRKTACPDGRNRALFMSIGDSRAATRNFDTLFSFDNPRRRYPDIKDDVWQYIIRSRVKEGMTRDECRLALGAPTSLERIPTTAGVAERWRYSDGIFLIFEDDVLTIFRL